MCPRSACSSTIDRDRGDDSHSSSLSLLSERVTLLLLRSSELSTLAGMKSGYVSCWCVLLADDWVPCLCLRGTVSEKFELDLRRRRGAPVLEVTVPRLTRAVPSFVSGLE